MRKTLFIIFCFFGFYQVQSQTTFSPGIRVGGNISNISMVESNHKPGFYVGFQGGMNFTKFYSFQPEIVYSTQGAKDINYYRRSYRSEDIKITIDNLSVQYLGVNLLNKFNFNDFNLQFGTGFDFLTNSKKDIANNIDFTVSLGLGYKIAEKFGAEIRFKKGIINAITDDEYFTVIGNRTNSVFQIGLYYNFKYIK